jgi:hypothetical protein
LEDEEMRETYIVEMLMKMVRMGMKPPVFELSCGMRLKVCPHNLELSIPKYKVGFAGGDVHKEQDGYTEITLTSDQLGGIMEIAGNLCQPGSVVIERPEKG